MCCLSWDRGWPITDPGKSFFFWRRSFLSSQARGENGRRGEGEKRERGGLLSDRQRTGRGLPEGSSHRGGEEREREREREGEREGEREREIGRDRFIFIYYIVI